MRRDQSVYIIRLVIWRIAVANMDVTETTGEQLRVGISLEELQIVKAALNEVCNGIEVFEFETRMGANRERVAALLKEVGALLNRMKVSGG